jgi:hypothetical protein
MRVFLFVALLAVASAVTLTPADQGQTIMTPSGLADGHMVAQGTVIATAAPVAMYQAKIEQPPAPCGCCGQATCGCCFQAPTTIAPEIKEPPATCGCTPTCFPNCMCPNTCGCCAAQLTHITPEIVIPAPALVGAVGACNCCHLNTCGCCKLETIAPEEKVVHVAPEVKVTPACPCAGQLQCACRV